MPAPTRPLARAARYLASCQQRSGCINDVVDPLAVLADVSATPAQRFRALNGADLWHTVHASLALGRLGKETRGPERYVRRAITDGGLCYWSARGGTCIETTAAAALLLRGKARERLRAVLGRLALPGGRWASYVLEGAGGHDNYSTGPSVSAWAALALGDAPTQSEVQSYLGQCLGDRPIWAPHAAFYATPFYAAHVAVRLTPEDSVLEYALENQSGEGGWGYGEPPGAPSTVPTSLALLTLAAYPRARWRGAVARAKRWLLGQQLASGAFPFASAPAEVWYAGEVYATSLAVLALTDPRLAAG